MTKFEFKTRNATFPMNFPVLYVLQYTQLWDGQNMKVYYIDSVLCATDRESMKADPDNFGDIKSSTNWL